MGPVGGPVLGTEALEVEREWLLSTSGEANSHLAKSQRSRGRGTCAGSSRQLKNHSIAPWPCELRTGRQLPVPWKYRHGPMPQSSGYQNCTRRPLGLEVAREARQPETLVPSKGDDHFTSKPRHKLRYISALFDRCGRHSARTTFKPYSCPRLLASPNRQGSLEARFSSSPHAVRDRRLKESLSL